MNKHSSYYLVDNGTVSCLNTLHNLENASKIRNRESKIMNVHFDRFVLSLKNKFEALRMSVFCEDSDPARGQAWGEVVFAHEVAAQLLRSRCQDGLR